MFGVCVTIVVGSLCKLSLVGACVTVVVVVCAATNAAVEIINNAAPKIEIVLFMNSVLPSF